MWEDRKENPLPLPFLPLLSSSTKNTTKKPLSLPKNHRMQNHHIRLLLLLTLMFSPATPTPPPSPPPQQMNNIIDALIGAGDFAAWVSILSSANATFLPVSATLFVPRDGAVDRPPPDPLLLPYHVVPQRLPFDLLILLPRLARLPTLLPTKSISITDNSAANFSLDATPLTHPDLFSTPSLAVHGVQAFLDYSLFGDGIPPPPPFLPIGDAIGTDWNSAASPSHSRSLLNDPVLFLFYFLLRVLL
ncbi:FAS1 domain-containing protein, partial [Mucuna pruriens]